MIRHANLDDLSTIETTTRQYPDELAFVRWVALIRDLYRHELFVAEIDSQVVGFVRWHACRDGWSTIYDLGVDRDFTQRGIGRALLYAVPCPIRLKCTADNERANRFYQHAGMTLAGTESGRKRPLNVWQMRILNIVVRGASKKVAVICRQSGSAYGIQERDMPYAWPFMVDVDFMHPNWPRYIALIRQYRPVQALVVDYTDPTQKQTMLAQVDDLRAAGVLRIVVCVKFPGATFDVPPDCIIGVSLRTDGRLTTGINAFAGYMPDFGELHGRRVHLLGGSPQLQKQTIIQLQGRGVKVLSVDGNAQFGAAARGSVYTDGVWRRKEGVKVPYYAGALESTRHIQRELNSIGELGQLALF